MHVGPTPVARAAILVDTVWNRALGLTPHLTRPLLDPNQGLDPHPINPCNPLVLRLVGGGFKVIGGDMPDLPLDIRRQERGSNCRVDG